jgi:RNA polymerase sigma factor for flagellar operon FliA
MANVAIDAKTDPHEEASMWEVFLGSADAGARARLIEMHLPFARIMAARMYAGRRHDEVEFAEYMQLATVGLIECVDRFDPSRGASFRTYAAHRITGSILNGLETASELHQQIAFRQRVRRERLDSLGGEEEGAAGTKALFESLASIAVGLALGYILEDSGMFREEERTMPDETYRSTEVRQLRAHVRGLVESLPERERRIIHCHYVQLVPFEAIAEMLGVTKGRVSQLHRRAIDMLREETRKVRKCDIAW